MPSIVEGHTVPEDVKGDHVLHIDEVDVFSNKDDQMDVDPQSLTTDTLTYTPAFVNEYLTYP